MMDGGKKALERRSIEGEGKDAKNAFDFGKRESVKMALAKAARDLERAGERHAVLKGAKRCRLDGRSVHDFHTARDDAGADDIADALSSGLARWISD